MRILLLVFLIYVLSIGPIGWLFINEVAPRDLLPYFETVYAPLKWLKQSSDSFAALLDSYISLWVDIPLIRGEPDPSRVQ